MDRGGSCYYASPELLLCHCEEGHFYAPTRQSPGGTYVVLIGREDGTGRLPRPDGPRNDSLFSTAYLKSKNIRPRLGADIVSTVFYRRIVTDHTIAAVIIAIL